MKRQVVCCSSELVDRFRCSRSISWQIFSMIFNGWASSGPCTWCPLPLLEFMEESGFTLSGEQGTESGICTWIERSFLVEGYIECFDLVLKGFYGSCPVSKGGNVWISCLYLSTVFVDRRALGLLWTNVWLCSL